MFILMNAIWPYITYDINQIRRNVYFIILEEVYSSWYI